MSDIMIMMHSYMMIWYDDDVIGHFTARSLHRLRPSVTSQPIQNKFNFTLVTSQSQSIYLHLQVCCPWGFVYIVILIYFIYIHDITISALTVTECCNWVLVVL